MSSQHNALNTFQPEKVAPSAGSQPSHFNSEYLLANALQAQQPESSTTTQQSFDGGRTANWAEQLNLLGNIPHQAIESSGLHLGQPVEIFNRSAVEHDQALSDARQRLPEFSREYLENRPQTVNAFQQEAAAQQFEQETAAFSSQPDQDGRLAQARRNLKEQQSSVRKTDQRYTEKTMGRVQNNLQEIRQQTARLKTTTSGRARLLHTILPGFDLSLEALVAAVKGENTGKIARQMAMKRQAMMPKGKSNGPQAFEMGAASERRANTMQTMETGRFDQVNTSKDMFDENRLSEQGSQGE